MLETLSNRLKGKVMIIGVGNPLRGDDAAGPYLIEKLRGQVDATLLDCEEVPENFLGKIVDSQPDSVVIIDAVHLGASPGAVAILEQDDVDNMSWSTHHTSLQLFMNCVKADTNADVFVLGIQPRITEFGSEISNEVKKTIILLQHIIPMALNGQVAPSC